MTNHLNITTIRAAELRELARRQPIELIDVRTPGEFQIDRAGGARNLPLAMLDPQTILNSRTTAPNEPIYFICEVGIRSAHACALMMAAGVSNVVNVEGGMQAWRATNLPAEQFANGEPRCPTVPSRCDPTEATSIWRQAQVGHGLLVLIGCAVGWLLHPMGYMFAALVGLGVLVSGITGICGMRQFMSKMPWNR